MKLLASVLLLAASACAHRGDVVAGSVETRAPAGTTIRLRHGAEDRASAERVRAALRTAVPLAEQWGALPRDLTITIHATHAALEAAAGGTPRPWLRGLARRGRIDLQSPRTWSTGTATEDQLVQLLAHELTHCVLHEALGGDPRVARGVPSWFWEGMATSTAGERFATSTASAPPPSGGAPGLNAGAASSSAPELYGAADRAFHALLDTAGRPSLQRLVAKVAGGVPFADAFLELTGVSLLAFEAEFGLATAPAPTPR